MAVTVATPGFGTLLKIDQAGGGYTTIAEVTDINGPGLSLATAKVTHQTSTGGWDEYIGTTLDAGELTFDINYAPTAASVNATTGLIADMVAKTLRNFQVIFTDAGTTTWVLPALVTNFTPAEPVDGALTASITLKVSGQPTLE